MDDVGLDSLSKDSSHHKRAESRGETCGIGQHNHTEAQPYRYDAEDFFGHETAHPTEECRDEEDAEGEPDNKEKAQHEHLHAELSAVKGLADGECAEYNKQQHGDKVFDDEYACNRRGELLLFEFEVVERLDDDSC